MRVSSTEEELVENLSAQSARFRAADPENAAEARCMRINNTNPNLDIPREDQSIDDVLIATSERRKASGVKPQSARGLAPGSTNAQHALKSGGD